MRRAAFSDEKSKIKNLKSKITAVSLLLLLSLSCGKKGDPQPPLPRGPRAVTDLAVEQEGGDAVLIFAFPDRLLTGAPLTDLASIEVFRVVSPPPILTEPRKTSAAPSGSSTGSAGALRLPGESERREATNVRLAEEAFYREAQSVATLDLASIAENTRGASVVYRDPLTALWKGGAGADPLAYAVISVRRNGERSPVSNIVTLTPAVAPAAPVLQPVIAEESRLCLEWDAPQTDVLGKPVEIGGYRVYRRALAEEQYGAPLNLQPVLGTSYLDTTAPYGVPLVYTVRAVVAGNPKVEGLPAEELPVLFADVFAPPAPPRLDALSEGNLVRLIWAPVDAPDLAGYLVFRAEKTGEPLPLTPQPLGDPFFTDESAKQGVQYRYSVRAVDRAGNRSAASPEATAEPF